MGRWLSVVDPSSTTGRCEVEKKLPKGALQVGFHTQQPNDWRVGEGMEREDVRVKRAKCKKRPPSFINKEEIIRKGQCVTD